MNTTFNTLPRPKRPAPKQELPMWVYLLALAVMAGAAVAALYLLLVALMCLPL